MKTRRWLFLVAAVSTAACEDKIPEPEGTARREPAPTASASAEPKELLKEDTVVGTGPVAETGDTVKVHYTGKLFKNNKKFDSSHDRGEPYEVVPGKSSVIKGWHEG